METKNIVLSLLLVTTLLVTGPISSMGGLGQEIALQNNLSLTDYLLINQWGLFVSVFYLLLTPYLVRRFTFSLMVGANLIFISLANFLRLDATEYSLIVSAIVLCAGTLFFKTGLLVFAKNLYGSCADLPLSLLCSTFGFSGAFGYCLVFSFETLETLNIVLALIPLILIVIWAFFFKLFPKNAFTLKSTHAIAIKDSFKIVLSAPITWQSMAMMAILMGGFLCVLVNKPITSLYEGYSFEEGRYIIFLFLCATGVGALCLGLWRRFHRGWLLPFVLVIFALLTGILWGLIPSAISSFGFIILGLAQGFAFAMLIVFIHQHTDSDRVFAITIVLVFSAGYISGAIVPALFLFFFEYMDALENPLGFYLILCLSYAGIGWSLFRNKKTLSLGKFKLK